MIRGRVFDYVPMEKQGFVRLDNGMVYGFMDGIMRERLCEGDAVWVDIVDGQVKEMWRI